MIYDFTLGRVALTNNLITNGTFNNNLNGWNANFVTWDNGTANFATHAGAPVSLTQAAVTETGKHYKLKFDVTVPFDWFLPWINWGKDNAIYPVGTHEIFGQDLGLGGLIDAQSGHIGFYTSFNILNPDGSTNTDQSGNIDNVECYEMVWNPPLRDEPIGWDQTNILIERDTSEFVDFIIEEFDGSLEFRGDGYDYLFDRFIQGDCEVPVRVRKDCGNGLKDYVEGVIFVTDIDFDLKKCLATVDIVDVYAQAIKDGSKSKVSLDFGNFFPDQDNLKALPFTDRGCHMHDRDGNRLPFDEQRNTYIVDEALKYLVLFGSDLKVGYQSTIFEPGQEFEYTLLTTGKELRKGENVELDRIGIETSFKNTMEELSKILNLGWYVNRSGANRFVIVSAKEDLFDNTLLFTLNDVQDIILKSRDIIFRSIETGFEFAKMDNVEGFIPNTVSYITPDSCSSEEFSLISKYGSDSQFFYRIILFPNTILAAVNAATTNNVQTAGESFLSQIIEGDRVRNITIGGTSTVTAVLSDTLLSLQDDLFTGTGQDYRIENTEKEDRRTFIIQGEIENFLLSSKIFTNNEYNGDLTNAKIMQRWIESLTSEVFKDDTNREEIVRATAPKNVTYLMTAAVNDQQLELIRDNPRGKIAFNGSATGEGWIKSFTRNESTGIAEIELIAEKPI